MSNPAHYEQPHVLIFQTTQKQGYSSLYEEIELIARNNERETYLVRPKESESPNQYMVARKTNIYSIEQQTQDEIFNQCTVLKQLNHPHIVKYSNVLLEGDLLIVVLEYCEEGDLAHYLRKRIRRRDFLSQRLILGWLLQILMALDHIHSHKIIHRGIEMSNLFLNSRGDIKLGSFGHSKILQRTNAKASTMVGRLGHMSPEMFQSKPYDSKSDMWALGCLLYQLATFTPLFDDRLPVTTLYEKVVNEPVPDLPQAYMKTLFPIYKKLLKKNPAQRPQAADLLKTPLFLSVMEEYISKKRIDSLDLREIPLKRLGAHDKPNEARRKDKGLVLPPLRKSGQTFTLTHSSLQGSHDFESEMEKSVQSEPPPSKVLRKSRSKDKKEKDRLPQQSVRSPRIEKHSSASTNLPAIDHKEKPIPRLTNRNQEQEYKHIEMLYKAQIGLICKELEIKYGPKMDLILERTLQFDPEDL